MHIIVVALGLILLLGLAEETLHRRALNRIPLRILVNGTRGKTSVTRLIASALNEAGMPAFAKTTGSEAKWILPDGTERSHRGKRPANMLEQLPFIRFAVRGGAQAVVVECMALHPENQWLMAEKLIRPHYTVITNTYVDHVEEIGSTPQETARTLSLSVPRDGTLITGDPLLSTYVTRVIPPEDPPEPREVQAFSFPVHDENLVLVLALANQLGVPRQTAIRGMLRTKPDIGMSGEFYVAGRKIINAFSANDPHSFILAMASCAELGEYALLYNHRSDRSFRLRTFARLLGTAARPPVRIGVIGDSKHRAARTFRRVCALPAEAVLDVSSWIHNESQPGQILCAGNIRGEGAALIRGLMKKGDVHG